MCVVNPLPITPTWNGPICPGCGRGYIQPSITWNSTNPSLYSPKHRKPGPAR